MPVRSNAAAAVPVVVILYASVVAAFALVTSVSGCVLPALIASIMRLRRS